jgi:hypothetical protein
MKEDYRKTAAFVFGDQRSIQLSYGRVLNVVTDLMAGCNDETRTRYCVVAGSGAVCGGNAGRPVVFNAQGM